MNERSNLRSCPVLVALTTVLLAACAGSEIAADGDAGSGATSGRSSAGGSARAGGVAAGGSDEVLAVVDGDEVTMADIEERVGTRLAELDYRHLSQRHQLVDATLRELVRDQLLEAEAASRGVDRAELEQSLVEGKVEVSEFEVEYIYQQNRAQFGGRSLEQMAPQIRQYLERAARERVLQEFADDLAVEGAVEYLLDPFRADIETAGYPSFGPDDAPVTLVEFSDFQCPYCKGFNETLDRIKQEYGEQIRLVFRHFPLNIHPNAEASAQASMCAQEQGKFWELHDAMFAEQDRLEIVDLIEKAERVGMDRGSFASCLESGRHADAVQNDLNAGLALGVNGTPALFVNGRPVEGGAVPYEVVAEVIDDELERLGAR